MRELHWAADDMFDRADAEASGGNQDRSCGPAPARASAAAPACRTATANRRVDRNAGNRDPLGGNPQTREVHARLLEGHEVAVDVAVKPHPMNIEVGDDNRQPCAGAAAGALSQETISAGRKCVHTTQAGSALITRPTVGC